MQLGRRSSQTAMHKSYRQLLGLRQATNTVAQVGQMAAKNRNWFAVVLFGKCSKVCCTGLSDSSPVFLGLLYPAVLLSAGPCASFVHTKREASCAVLSVLCWLAMATAFRVNKATQRIVDILHSF